MGSPAARIEEDRNRAVATRVYYCHVHLVIVVEVACSHGVRICWQGICRKGLEGSAAIVQQNGKLIGECDGNNKVRFAITIEIRSRNPAVGAGQVGVADVVIRSSGKKGLTVAQETEMLPGKVSMSLAVTKSNIPSLLKSATASPMG